MKQPTLTFLCSSCLLTISLYAASPPQNSGQAPLRWDLFFQPLPILFLIGGLILTGLAWLVWQKRQKKEFIPGPEALGASNESLKQFYAWVPAILGIHVAIALLVNGVQGWLLAANNTMPEPWSNWIGLAEIGIALSFFYGGLTRPAAILLAALWLLGFDLVGPRPMLEVIQYLGFAAFFYLNGRGPYAIDRLLFPNLEPAPNYTGYAMTALRIGVGLNLIIFGMTQKFANIPFASSLLEGHLFLNFTAIPNEIFILLAASLEVLAGLLIAFGIFTRTVSILTLIAINASLTITYWPELIDYLPTYGALAVLLVWEPNGKHPKLWVEGAKKN